MREMRRKEKQMEENEALEILRMGEYGLLSTVDSEGQPYAVPLNYVFLDNAICFHCATQGYKLDNIRENSRVCFTVVGQCEVVAGAFTTKYQSVVVFGHAVETVGQEKEALIRKLIAKYSLSYMEKAEQIIAKGLEKFTVVKMDITHITGKKNE